MDRMRGTELRSAGAGLAILVVLVTAFALFEPRFLNPINVRNIFRIAAITVLATYGQAFVLLSGKIDLSMGSLAGFVSVIAGMSLKRFGIAPSFAIALATGVAIGVATGTLVFLFRLPAFIITFGMLTSLTGFANLLTRSAPIELIGVKGFDQVGSGYIGPVPIPVVIAVVAFLLLRTLLARTAFGRTIVALGYNERVARLAGRKTVATGIATYGIAGFLVAAAALIMSSRVYSAQPNLAPELPFEAIAAAAIGGVSLRGGKGNLLQATVGALIVTTLINGLNLLNVSTYLQMMTRGAIILLAVVVNNVREIGLVPLLDIRTPRWTRPRRTT